MSRRRVLSPYAAALLVSGVAAAQPAEGPEFKVNAYTTGSQILPEVSMNARTGQFVIAYQETPTGCAAHVFDVAAAELHLMEWSICASPSVALLAPGGGVVADIDSSAAPNSGAVAGFRFNDIGFISAFRANTYTTGKKGDVRVASDVNGNFVVVWADARSGAYQIFQRRYLYSGEPAGLVNEFRVDTGMTNIQRGSSIAMDAAGEYVVVWQSAPFAACCAHIFGQRYDSSGNAQASAFRVDESTAGSYFPDVASDTAGNFAVVWTSYDQYGNFSYNVHGRRYSASGAPLGHAFRINTYTNGKMGLPRVARPDSEFVIVWQELQGGGDQSGYAVLGRRYAPDGSSLGASFRVNTSTSSNQYRAAIAARPAGPFVVAWESYTGSFAKTDIFAQRYCLNGDVNGDGHVDVADVFYLINFLFAGGPPPLGCSDVNGNATLDVADVFYLINYLFAGGPAPV